MTPKAEIRSIVQTCRNVFQSHCRPGAALDHAIKLLNEAEWWAVSSVPSEPLPIPVAADLCSCGREHRP